MEGDLSAERFRRFYEAEYGRMVRLGWLLTGDASLAEDLAQEAFLSAHRRFEDVSDPILYVHRALINRAKTWKRDEFHRRLKVARLQPQAEVHMVEKDDELLAAVRRLPYRQRVVVVSRYWAGWSEQEIAAVLNCRPGTVKSLCSRALSRLRSEVTSR